MFPREAIIFCTAQTDVQGGELERQQYRDCGRTLHLFAALVDTTLHGANGRFDMIISHAGSAFGGNYACGKQP
jgi:hypothetical protein